MDFGKFDKSIIEQMIKEAIQEVTGGAQQEAVCCEPKYGIFDSMNDAIEASEKAWKILLNTSKGLVMGMRPP